MFKHLLYSLCSIVNKILAQVIWKSFLVYILFKFKKGPNISEIRVVDQKMYTLTNAYFTAN